MQRQAVSGAVRCMTRSRANVLEGNGALIAYFGRYSTQSISTLASTISRASVVLRAGLLPAKCSR